MKAMKKLMYVISLTVISGVLLSCSEELVSPIDEGENVEVPSGKSSTEVGEEPVNPDDVTARLVSI